MTHPVPPSHPVPTPSGRTYPDPVPTYLWDGVEDVVKQEKPRPPSHTRNGRIEGRSATTPQRWHCPRCGLRYESPLPLAHPPNHRCRPQGGPGRIRKMEPEQ